MAAILRVLRQGERFLVCSHSRPDGDAVGSMLALGMLLEQMGKSADLFRGSHSHRLSQASRASSSFALRCAFMAPTTRRFFSSAMA